jgi:UDP-glucose 4-epimerase
MNILITGGTGFIGSHTVLAFLDAGHTVSVIDNLSNSNEVVVQKLEFLSSKKLDFQKIDLIDFNSLDNFLANRNIDAVIHFAGLKAVSESVQYPERYFRNNILGTINLLSAMQKNNVKKLIFSSSATVYGDPKYFPIDENHPTSSINPYGRSKLHLEEIIQDIANADSNFFSICLRYFNPIGAHYSGLIGESPSGIPNNLMPYIIEVASKKLPHLKVFGDDYDTPDGTGVRDYVHVQDIANGHLSAFEYLSNTSNKTNHHFFNLGTGSGTSVLELIRQFEKTTNIKIPIKITERRPGDIAQSYAEISKAQRILNWKAEFGLEQMISSSWNYYLQSNN